MKELKKLGLYIAWIVLMSVLIWAVSKWIGGDTFIIWQGWTYGDIFLLVCFIQACSLMIGDR